MHSSTPNVLQVTVNTTVDHKLITSPQQQQQVAITVAVIGNMRRFLTNYISKIDMTAKQIGHAYSYT